jgi:hypothetical protein
MVGRPGTPPSARSRAVSCGRVSAVPPVGWMCAAGPRSTAEVPGGARAFGGEPAGSGLRSTRFAAALPVDVASPNVAPARARHPRHVTPARDDRLRDARRRRLPEAAPQPAWAGPWGPAAPEAEASPPRGRAAVAAGTAAGRDTPVDRSFAGCRDGYTARGAQGHRSARQHRWRRPRPHLRLAERRSSRGA